MDISRERKIFSIIVFSFIAVTAIVSSVYVYRKDHEVKGVQKHIETVSPPSIVNLMPSVAYVGEEYIFVPKISSSEDNSAKISIVEGPDWLTIDDVGIIRGYPNIIGTFKIVLRVENTNGSSQVTDYIIVKENE